MLRSMYSGIGGMRGFQTKLDVIGNNIANVNTAGFKKSRTQFQDILSQTMAGGNAPTTTTGGTNSKQVGLGSTLAAIDVIHTQGGMMNTNVPSDLAIEGNGFFVVAPIEPATSATSIEKEAYFLTRAGNFSIDADGNLVTANGMFVLGADKTTAGTTQIKKVNLYDVAGETDPAKYKDYQIDSYSIAKNGELTVKVSRKDGASVGLTAKKIHVGLATVQNPAGLEKNGSNLYRVTSSSNGNGGADDTDLSTDATSTGVFFGLPNEGNRGPIYAGQLEMSNTDLSEEFTEMIVAQRGFQANSRIITTSDSILEELVNLKR